MDRRKFFNLVGAAGIASLTAKDNAQASESAAADAGGTFGILVDLTACAGCGTCGKACAALHELPEPPEWDGESKQETSDTRWTVVNKFKTGGGDVFVKHQCMHCVTPACACACLTKALVKTPEGPVIWREDKCMGCRYCMISCPFEIPKFEFNSPVPRIQKCRMCWEQVKEGEKPTCVEFCPMEATTFGKRSELLEIARQRIYQNPGKYVSHVYGEREAGGTGVLYISPVPFEELGFATDLGETPMPEYTRGFLSAVPLVLTVWPAFLLGLHWATRRSDDENHRPDENSAKEV